MAVRMEATTGQLETLAAAGRELADAGSLDEALSALARAAAAATGAALAVIRVPDSSGGLPSRGVWSTSAALGAELEGSRLVLEEVGTKERTESEALPPAVRRLAEQSGAAGVLLMPALADGRVLASLELMRPGERFSATERMVAQIAAQQAGLLVRAFEPPDRGTNGRATLCAALELAGRALTAGAEEARSADRIARLAAEVTEATSCLLWRVEDGKAEPIAAVGVVGDVVRLAQEAENELAGEGVATSEAD